MECAHVLIVLLATVIIPAIIKAEKDGREQDLRPVNKVKESNDVSTPAVVKEILMGKTTWGTFGTPIFCDQGSRVFGFRLRVQPKQGIFDDSALNGIQLACTNGKVTEQIVGVTGEWLDWVHCEGKLKPGSKFIVGFDFRSEKKHAGDNTGGDNVRMQCSDGKELDGGGMDWGTWDSSVDKSCDTLDGVVGLYLCGVQARIEKHQTIGDNTGLNQIKFKCCGRDLKNIALGKNATQSSTAAGGNHKAGYAVDGNMETLSDTATDIAWWRVDLGKPATIYKVRLYTYDKYFGSVKTTTVTVGNSVVGAGMTSCGMFNYLNGKMRREGKYAQDITCAKPVAGRYIQVTKNSPNHMLLYIREFEAYGQYI